MAKAKLDLRSPREVAQFHDSIIKHPNPDVRLAADQIALAATAAKLGDIQGLLTYIDLAKLFAKDVNYYNPVERI